MIFVAFGRMVIFLAHYRFGLTKLKKIIFLFIPFKIFLFLKEIIQIKIIVQIVKDVYERFKCDI